MIRRGAEIEKHLDLLRIYGMLLQIYDFEAARRTKLEMDVQLIFWLLVLWNQDKGLRVQFRRFWRSIMIT